MQGLMPSRLPSADSGEVEKWGPLNDQEIALEFDLGRNSGRYRKCSPHAPEAV